uniref:6-phosphogluconolactonase n=1 Tax=Flavobacterium sp. TaxID=239 RepID=UPI0040498134
MDKLAFKTVEWVEKCCKVIHDNILYFLERDGYCSIVLTGGRSAEQVYNVLANYLPQYKGRIDFFIGDERCVPETDPESNYGMIVNSLFKNQASKIKNLYKFHDSVSGIEDNLARYENQLPQHPNLLLLGLGDDGHIASLFPRQDYSANNNLVAAAVSPNGQQRVTITPSYIGLAEKVIILAYGPIKKEIVSKMSVEVNPLDVPARWAYKGLWLTVR